MEKLLFNIFIYLTFWTLPPRGWPHLSSPPHSGYATVCSDNLNCWVKTGVCIVVGLKAISQLRIVL